MPEAFYVKVIGTTLVQYCCCHVVSTLVTSSYDLGVVQVCWLVGSKNTRDANYFAVDHMKISRRWSIIAWSVCSARHLSVDKWASELCEDQPVH